MTYSRVRLCDILAGMRNIALFLLLALGILSAAELTVVLTTVPPETASRQELWTFFISLGIVIGSWGSLIWHTIKSRLIYRVNPPALTATVRQAFLFSAVVTLGLFFNSLGILSVWDILPLGLATVLIEFFFQAEKTPAHTLS